MTTGQITLCYVLLFEMIGVFLLQVGWYNSNDICTASNL